jgi:hypothetical protein
LPVMSDPGVKRWCLHTQACTHAHTQSTHSECDIMIPIFNQPCSRGNAEA